MILVTDDVLGQEKALAVEHGRWREKNMEGR